MQFDYLPRNQDHRSKTRAEQIQWLFQCQSGFWADGQRFWILTFAEVETNRPIHVEVTTSLSSGRVVDFMKRTVAAHTARHPKTTLKWSGSNRR